VGNVPLNFCDDLPTLIDHMRRSSRKGVLNGNLMTPQAIRSEIPQIGSIHLKANIRIPFPAPIYLYIKER
jgi:hypothetical protein